MANTVFDLAKIGSGERLSLDFYIQTDVVQIARDLIGKVLVTQFNGRRTAGLITETEAYRAPDDRASHAYGNRRTARTEVMFGEGGRAYIYLCYGIHHLFNVVTAPAETAHAVLIRGVEPIEGVELMMHRRNFSTLLSHKKSPHNVQVPTTLTTGPGALSQALGLTTEWTGKSFFDADTPVWIEDRGMSIPEKEIIAGKRIGVDYAGECAHWPWRFWLKNSRFVKR